MTLAALRNTQLTDTDLGDFAFEKNKQTLNSYLKPLRIMRKTQQINGTRADLAKIVAGGAALPDAVDSC